MEINMLLSVKKIFSESRIVSFCKITTLAFLLILISSSLSGADYYVSKKGNDLTGDGTKLLPWKTISKALASVSPSQADPARIRIGKGNYIENLDLISWIEIYGGYNDSFWTRNTSSNKTIISPASASSSDPVIEPDDNTVIDGIQLENGKYGISCKNVSPLINDCYITGMTTTGIMASGSAASPEITFCTIKNCKEGIYLYNPGTPIIRDNIIKENTGNAITAQNCSPVIERNILKENALAGLNLSMVSGGTVSSNQILRNNSFGIYCMRSSPQIVNNIIAFNLSAGIDCRNNSNPKILFNSIYLNSNGVVLQGSSPEIINNISIMNESYGVMEADRYSTPVLRNNCLWNNEIGNYLDRAEKVLWTSFELNNEIDNGTSPVEANISQNPEFGDVGNDNFHLLPSSPCIDAGYNVAEITEDYEGTPRSDNKADIGADEYIDLFTFTFDNGSEGWNFVSIPTVFDAPLSEAANGLLSLKSTSSYSYGYWESPFGYIPVFENILYKGTWKISTDVTDQSKVPGMRLRFNEQDFQMSAEMLVNSNLNGEASPTPEGKIYEMYYRPLQGSSYKSEKANRILCAFDLVNLTTDDQADGGLFLDELTIEWKDISAIKDNFTTETIFNFTIDKEGWGMHSAKPVFEEPVDVSNPTYLGLQSSGSNTYGYMESPPQSVSSDKLYRTRFYVATDTTPRSEVPMLRIRINSLINHTSFSVKVDSNLDGDSSPINTEWSVYEIYYTFPKSVESDGVFLAYDIINLNPADNPSGSLYVDRVEVHSVDLPLF
jgi:parallel beta-helix repeat protein